MLAWAVISDNRTDSSGIWLWRNRRGIGRNCEAAIRFVPGDMCNLSLSPAGEEEEEFRNDSALLEIACMLVRLRWTVVANRACLINKSSRGGRNKSEALGAHSQD